MWTTPVNQLSTYALGVMELALILLSLASFFALIVAWTVMPVSERTSESATAAAAAQAAH